MVPLSPVRHLVGPLLCVLGVALYFVVAIRLAWWRRIPWEFLALVGAGVAFALVDLLSAPGVGSGASALVSLALAGFAGWYFFHYSQYGARAERPGEGAAFPDFDLPTSVGGRLRLEDLRGRPALLIFYRGLW